jgi:hypothetical protein
MKAEKLLLKKGVSIKLIPVPREFSSDCGLSLRFDWDQRDTVAAELTTAGVESMGIHQMLSK